MPWTAKDACKHDHDACASPKKARQWKIIANKAKAAGDSDQKAIMKASGVVSDLDLSRTPLVVEADYGKYKRLYKRNVRLWATGDPREKESRATLVRKVISSVNRSKARGARGGECPPGRRWDPDKLHCVKVDQSDIDYSLYDRIFEGEKWEPVAARRGKAKAKGGSLWSKLRQIGSAFSATDPQARRYTKTPR